MAKLKVDLTLLKRLVGELESSLLTVDSLNSDTKPDVHELTIEASKAAGLAAGIVREASMLIMDIDAVVQSTQSSPKSKSDFLDKLVSSLGGKIPGTN